MRILIIESDVILAEQLRKKLQCHSFAVDLSHNGQDGSYMARVNDYDVIIISSSLSKKSGQEVCQDIRKIKKTVPIIVVSESTNMDEKLAFLYEGADDHMIKPFSFDEILARIQVLLRRPVVEQQPVLNVDTVKLDCRNQSVTRDEKKIYLTRKEFALLEYLMRNKGAVVSRSMIMEHVWDDAADPFSNTIESHILNLRKKVDIRRRLIHNVPGRGYKMDVVK